MTTDSKRLVRGEHWLTVRTQLRRRDAAHNRKWKILILPGENPNDEIDCIRSLMPKARIVAVDRKRSAVKAAKKAGASVAIKCNLRDFREAAPKDCISRLPLPISEEAPFDAINLDLCCNIQKAGPLLHRYSQALTKGGMLMVTFSYGRDVREIFDSEHFGPVPPPLGARVRLAAQSAKGELRIQSVLSYSGNQMPMCSCFWGPGRKWVDPKLSDGKKVLNTPVSYAKIGDDDLYAAAVGFDSVDPALLYALPAERIAHFRRKLAAQKAVATRESRRKKSATG